MIDRRGSAFSHARASEAVASPFQPNFNNIEMTARPSSIPVTRDSYQVQSSRRRTNYQAIIESPLARFTDDELEADVRYFHANFLPFVDLRQLLRAVNVAKEIRAYDEVARSPDPHAGRNLPVQLTADEKLALKREKDSLPSEPTMLVVILTVSLAAFLQGFVQSSINGASLYPETFGLKSDLTMSSPDPTPDWKLGAVNASPFLSAALVGCWLALPTNDLVGRRGSMAIAACLIFASSLGSVFCESWQQLLGVRIIGGIGMGIKAVSTPILASETAVSYWRGTSILAWQLWVAFGIAIGFAFNLIFYTARAPKTTAGLILGAPLVPSLFLLCSLCFCPESPRYYMRPRSACFNAGKAYNILRRLRKEEIQALRDIYLIYRSVQQEGRDGQPTTDALSYGIPQGFVGHLKAYITQYKELFTKRRLRNALISSSIVALAQQLCGINILAFYSGPLFNAILASDDEKLIIPEAYSLGFGAINFLFGLPAIRTIDRLGRRKWLMLTLPAMSICMLVAALSTKLSDRNAHDGVIAFFIFAFAAFYSPGMGPIPFTLASESFPLSHREAGCAFAIAINLGFAGLLSIFLPSIYARLGDGGTLGLFAGLNLVALILVFLLVEETKRRTLEDLDSIFDVRKTRFTRYQVRQYLPWFFRRYILGRNIPKPELYLDLIWGNHGQGEGQGQGQGKAGGDGGSGSASVAAPGIGTGIEEEEERAGNENGNDKAIGEGVSVIRRDGGGDGLIDSSPPFAHDNMAPGRRHTGSKVAY